METDTPVRETERILTDEEAAERAARKEAAREARRKKKQRKKRIKTALLIVLSNTGHRSRFRRLPALPPEVRRRVR